MKASLKYDNDVSEKVSDQPLIYRIRTCGMEFIRVEYQKKEKCGWCDIEVNVGQSTPIVHIDQIDPFENYVASDYFFRQKDLERRK